jgi:hypothetical protein
MALPLVLYRPRVRALAMGLAVVGVAFSAHHPRPTTRRIDPRLVGAWSGMRTVEAETVRVLRGDGRYGPQPSDGIARWSADDRFLYLSFAEAEIALPYALDREGLVIDGVRQTRRPIDAIDRATPLWLRKPGLWSGAPAGLMNIPRPSEGSVLCSSDYAKVTWGVAMGAHGVALIRDPEPSEWDDKTLAVEDGFFIAWAPGPFDRDVRWMSWDGVRTGVLPLPWDVRALVPGHGGEVLVLTGEAEWGSEGEVHCLRNTTRGWTITRSSKLTAYPSAYFADGDDLLVVTGRSLERITREHRVEELYPLKVGGFYPNSLAVDADGVVWIGLRHLILALIPDRLGYVERWFAAAVPTRRPGYEPDACHTLGLR